MFEEDLSVFFNNREHAEEGVYTPEGGTPSNVLGIFDNNYIEVSIGEAGVSGSVPSFMCDAADLPDVAYGDALQLRGTDYSVVEIQPDGQGVVTLILEEQ